MSIVPADLHVANQLLAAALDYAARGWSIIPVCGKRPTGLWEPFQKQAADGETLRRMFARSGVTGLAVITGSVSGGLVCRDFDREDAYERWAAQNSSDAVSLPTVRTRRGYHVYGHLDQEVFENLDDGELRGDCGHYVVLPPSQHPDGGVYVWLVPLPPCGAALVPLPRTLCAFPPVAETQAHPSPLIACASITEAIACTLPDGPGQRNRRLFDLARCLRRHIADAGSADLREIVREWYERALPVIRTKDFGETWADFVVAWDRVKHAAGCSLRAAVAALDAGKLPPIAERYDGALKRLVGLCWNLQKQSGDRPFHLGCRMAGRCIGVSPKEAWKMLRSLRFDKVLRLKRKGKKQTGKASEWRFIGKEA